jgi:glycosyltransferase involved in cell wall biosynthesis
MEDFGITAIESMASGCPVIAFGRGGARETIEDKKTGLFFNEQTPGAITEAVHEFENIDFDREYIRRSVAKFDVDNFKGQIREFIEKNWEDFRRK